VVRSSPVDKAVDKESRMVWLDGRVARSSFQGSADVDQGVTQLVTSEPHRDWAPRRQGRRASNPNSRGQSGQQ